MMKIMDDSIRKSWMFLFLVFLFTTGSVDFGWSAESLARFTLLAEQSIHKNTPICVPMENLPILLNKVSLKLERIDGSGRLTVPFQIESGNPAKLWWILDDGLSMGEKQEYELVLGKVSGSPLVHLSMNDRALELGQGDRQAIRYQYSPMLPPPDQDLLYTRSAFIHPIWSPGGKVLTRIHSSDHIHHMGFWTPWTNTEFEGRHVDFWNLGEGQGTVRFVKFNSTMTGPVFAGFEALQEHVDLSAPGSEEIILNELWAVRLWAQSEAANAYFIWDFTTTQSCASSSPLILKKYRYGGFGFRGTSDWNEKNSNYLTSEGKTREDGNGTRARWCNIYGMTDKGPAGVLLLSHPSNHEFPEPMRIWPKGDIFFGFCPVVYKDWVMRPGQEYVRKYRIIVYDGTLSTEQAERFWHDFTTMTDIKVNWKNKE
jgi:hypothetical protein